MSVLALTIPLNLDMQPYFAQLISQLLRGFYSGFLNLLETKAADSSNETRGSILQQLITRAVAHISPVKLVSTRSAGPVVSFRALASFSTCSNSSGVVDFSSLSEKPSI